MSASLVGHLDADSFYVSAERVRHSFLAGKPVGVLGNQGACVIARSREMKAAGVGVGTPIWDAARLCPQGVYVKRDFRWYEVISRAMLAVVQEFSPRVEYYSIDEFFFEVPRDVSPQSAAEAIRDRVLQRVGVPATVGVARSKSLAKLISDNAKPFGALAVTDEEGERRILAERKVDDITGIASRRAAKLAPFGIATALDFINADRRLIRQLLTVEGARLWWELRGEPVRPIQTTRPPHKMLSRGGSIGAATDDPDRVVAWAVRHLERLVEELEHHRVHAGQLSVYVGHKGAPSGSGMSGLMAPTNRFDLLLEVTLAGLRQAWSGAPVQRLHLFASKLQWPGFVQGGLFDPPAEEAVALAKVKREINTQLGRFKLRSAATLYLAENYRDDAQGYDICDVRGKMCF